MAIGQGLALLLGLVGFLGGNYFLIVIAIFIWFGALAGREQVALRRMLGGATVGQAMASGRRSSATDPLDARSN